jgi:thiol-disulfide isomerase/thioredoxin
VTTHPRTILSIATLLILALTTGCVQVKNTSAADDFMFTTLAGEQKNLSDYLGSPILIDFMGVNCPPCQQEMFVLNQLHHNYTDLTIISIDVWTSQGENANSVQQLKDQFQTKYNILLDWTFALDDAQASLGHRFAADGVPHLYLYTKQGNLYYSHLGYEDYSTLATKVKDITS